MSQKIQTRSAPGIDVLRTMTKLHRNYAKQQNNQNSKISKIQRLRRSSDLQKTKQDERVKT